MKNYKFLSNIKTMWSRSILLILIILISIFLVQLILTKKDQSSLKVSPSPALKSYIEPYVSPTPTEPKIDDLISYQIPKNWIKKVIYEADNNGNEINRITLSSPNFEEGKSFNVKAGASISINRTKNENPLRVLDSIIKEDSANLNYRYDRKRIKVDGYESVSLHEDYEGHSKFYYIAKNNYLWQISVRSPSLNEEKSYEALINSFIESLKFR